MTSNSVVEKVDEPLNLIDVLLGYSDGAWIPMEPPVRKALEAAREALEQVAIAALSPPPPEIEHD